ncbi:MAG: ABC transporter permease [Spirochaetales bacterium]|nr:ABC transporter permease [Spirochaetales bacterium]
MKLLPLAARNIRRNVRRTILSATATAIATMTLMFLFAYIDGMKMDFSYVLSTFVSGHGRIRHAEYDDLEHLNPLHLRIVNYTQVIDYLKADPRVAGLSPRINLPAMFYQAGADEQTGVRAIGVDFVRETTGMNLENILVSGAIPAPGDRGVLVGTTLARELGLEVGDTVTLLSQTMRRDTNAVSFTLRGIIEFPVAGLNKGTMLLPLEGAQRLSRMGDSVSEILYRLQDPSDARQVAGEIEGLLAQQGFSTGDNPLSVKSWDQVDMIFSFMGMADLIYGIFGSVFFILASTVLINTTMMVINERTREIGTIGALGMLGSEIVRLFFLEALIIAVLGAFGGILLGAAIVVPLQIIGMDLSSATEGMEINISGLIYPQFNLVKTILVWFYAVVLTGLVALIPSRRASKILPVEALRYQG